MVLPRPELQGEQELHQEPVRRGGRPPPPLRRPRLRDDHGSDIRARGGLALHDILRRESRKNRTENPITQTPIIIQNRLLRE